MGEYKFRNPHFYSNRPLSELKGIILLTPLGEAEQIAKSNVFIGTVEDTVGTWFNKIKAPKFAIGDFRTTALFNRAESGDQTAQQDIIKTAVSACLEKSRNIFPPAPIFDHFYHIQVMPSNEVTGSCFLAVFVYQ